MQERMHHPHVFNAAKCPYFYSSNGRSFKAHLQLAFQEIGIYGLHLSYAFKRLAGETRKNGKRPTTEVVGNFHILLHSGTTAGVRCGNG